MVAWTYIIVKFLRKFPALFHTMHKFGNKENYKKEKQINLKEGYSAS